MSKLVSIIIPSLHRPDLTQKCIHSISRQTLSTRNFEVIVVENEGKAESFMLPPYVRRLVLDSNYGTTGSINRGLAMSESEFILILNNDVELEPAFLDSLVSTLEQNPGSASATGKLLRASNHGQIDGAGDALLLGGGAYRLGHFDCDLGQFDKPGFVLSGCGAATLYRRSVLTQIGGLDEDLFAYLDDVDLALRILLLGFRCRYVPEAVAYHVGSATLGDALHPKIVELITRNQLLIVLKSYPSGILLRTLPRRLVFQLLWMGHVIRRRAVRAYLLGLWGAVRLLPRMLRKRREIVRSRRIRDTEFLAGLRASERQVYEWHSSRPANAQSLLLRVYFGLFGTR